MERCEKFGLQLGPKWTATPNFNSRKNWAGIDQNVKIVNPWSVDENFEYLNMDESRYLSQVNGAFQGFDYDIVGVSAGFDTYLEDWGKLLKKEDYYRIGKVIKEGAKMCDGHRFAVLEGGYHPDLKWCIKSFIEGFR